MQLLYLMSRILLYYQVQQRFDNAVEHDDFTVPALQVHKHKLYNIIRTVYSQINE